MPAKQSPKKSLSTPAPGDLARPSADASDAASVDASTPDRAGDAAEAEVPVALNRAERRARGKGAAQPPPHGRGKVTGGKGPSQSSRMWSNRRSGG